MKNWKIMLVVAFITGAAHAANLWDGGGTDNNWNTGANWDNNAVPSFPVGLNFGGTTRLTSNNDLSSLTVNGFTFDSGAGAFVIGGNAITLGGDITNNSSNTQTIDIDMALDATREVNMASTQKVILNGDLSGVGGLTVSAIGTPELLLYGNNTFDGGITMNSGVVRAFSDTAFGTGDVTLNGGRWSGGGNVTLANNFNLAANSLGNSLSSVTDFTGQFSGTGDFRINGFLAGTVKLSGDNSGWSGNWEFQGGNKLQLNHVNALGSGTTIIFDNATSAGSSRGTLETLVAMTGANAISQNITLGTIVYSNNTATIRTTADLEQTGVISGNATTRLIKDGSGRLYLNGTNTYSGGTTLSAGVVVTYNDASFGTGDVTFDGAQWNSENSAVISNDIEFAKNMTGNSLGDVTEFAGQFTGTGNLAINGFESGTVKLSGDNSGWSGNWKYNGRNKLQLNHVNALGTGTTITFSSPGSANYIRGNLESLVDLTGANALTQDVILGETATSNNIARITTTADMELAGVVSGSADAALVKLGDGALILSQANTYEGTTSVEAGALVAAADSALGSNDVSVSSGAVLVLTNGVSNDYIADAANLVLDAAASLDLAFTGTPDAIGSLSLDGGSTTIADGTYNAAALSGLGSGTYTGAGSLVVGAGGIGSVDSAVLPGGTSLSLSWTAASGVSYAVQTNVDLVDGMWGDSQIGITGSGVVLITNDLIGPVGFYRIVVE
jgi:autotransporter-associated beta strand protein